jgi:hypothetical protein
VSICSSSRAGSSDCLISAVWLRGLRRIQPGRARDRRRTARHSARRAGALPRQPEVLSHQQIGDSPRKGLRPQAREENGTKRGPERQRRKENGRVAKIICPPRLDESAQPRERDMRRELAPRAEARPAISRSARPAAPLRRVCARLATTARGRRPPNEDSPSSRNSSGGRLTLPSREATSRANVSSTSPMKRRVR